MSTSQARIATAPSSWIDWEKLGFKERDVNGLVRVRYKGGKWANLEISKDHHLNIHAAAPCLNYGQQAFEGIKAFRSANGSVKVFRPQENWSRMNLSARMASMPELPEELFLEAIKVAVALNLEYVPPYKKNASGGALYIRPLLIATGPMLMLGAPDEFTFLVWVTPVGSLYGSGAEIPAVDGFVLDTFDRSAPMGTGYTKLGGNYAPVFGPTAQAKKQGYPITLHLDSATHTNVDEFSTSNALAIQKEGDETTLVVPESTSILRSVTKVSVVEIAEKLCGWKVELRQVAFEELKQNKFAEFMAAGTAAGITPVRSMSYNSHKPQLQHEKLSKEGPKYTLPAENKIVRIDFGDGKTAGECSQRLFDELTSYQCGDQEDKFGWLWPAEGIVAEDAKIA
ncbi:related to branched-chain amino acid aminotransferase [Ustilago bromivora]|uniref:Related to branched-chain amino acid aminotransferase n=1 Tax=Ustilago bromivora TaxID=307758 RepID=A0A1K0G3Y3_9BASI|nr:related to branched-chain amino acid aminotransferase [Ustilago bromivora]SYW80723.1 related to branched-chain amino acid aminotransferase [Ustilago bromivora]